MTAVLVDLGDGVAYEPMPGVFAGVRAACPRCPWRAERGVTAGSMGWRQWLALDVRRHECTNPAPDQEKPS